MERIVDQVVNPKINSVFLPKVEEIVYSYLGIKKPSRNEVVKHERIDLLPNDLEAVSPESEPVDKKDDKSTDTFQDLDESKTEEDESPPFEPLEEQSVYVPHEENSVDSHLSGFSGICFFKVGGLQVGFVDFGNQFCYCLQASLLGIFVFFLFSQRL